MIVFLVAFAQLGLLGVIAWAVARVVVRRRRAEDQPADLGEAVRRAFLYAVLFGVMVVSAIGVTDLAAEAFDRVRLASRTDAVVARSLAFLVIGIPVGFGVLRIVLRRLDSPTAGDAERRSVAWLAYLNGALALALILLLVHGAQLVKGLLGGRVAWQEAVPGAIVWGGLWAAHWFLLLRRHAPETKAHLAFGSLAGLLALSAGAGGTLADLGRRGYDRAADDVLAARGGPALRTWIGWIGVGAATWLWHWHRRYRRADRDGLWHVLVVLVGSLGGLLACIVASGITGFRTLQWWWGDPGDPTAWLHFRFLPVALAALVVGLTSWRYHRWVLAAVPTVERTEPLRVYDYLLAAAGLVTGLLGATFALEALILAITPAPFAGRDPVADRALLAVTLVTIGVPLWVTFWRRVERLFPGPDSCEVRSPTRRVYLLGTIGVAGTIMLVSAIRTLTITLKDLLGGELGSSSLRAVSVPLALLLTVSGAAWFHLAQYRQEHERATPTAPPPPLRRIVLVGATTGSIGAALRTGAAATVTCWRRTDASIDPPVDVAALAARIRSAPPGDLLVLLDSPAPRIVPFERAPAG